MAYGAAGTVITGSPPTCRVWRSSAQSITQAVLTPVTFDTNRFDPTGMHSTVTNTSRITFTSPGVYLVGGNLEWAAGSTSFRLLGIRLNGTTVIDQIIHDPDTTGVGTQQNVSTIYKFAANDYVELICQQNSAGALNVSSLSDYSPSFYAMWMGLGT